MEHFWLNISFLVMGLYAFSLLLVFFYSLAQLHLLFNYKKAQNNKPELTPLDVSDIEKVPYVTIQLPVFNELYVMERLLRCINEIEYPRERLEIQVLDDSTDESVELTKSIVQELQKGGLDIVQIRREDRVGFKAGALKEGLKTAKGEFVAIFDADFSTSRLAAQNCSSFRPTRYWGCSNPLGAPQPRLFSLDQSTSLCSRCTFYFGTSRA